MKKILIMSATLAFVAGCSGGGASSVAGAAPSTSASTPTPSTSSPATLAPSTAASTTAGTALPADLLDRYGRAARGLNLAAADRTPLDQLPARARDLCAESSQEIADQLNEDSPSLLRAGMDAVAVIAAGCASRLPEVATALRADGDKILAFHAGRFSS